MLVYDKLSIFIPVSSVNIKITETDFEDIFYNLQNQWMWEKETNEENNRTNKRMKKTCVVKKTHKTTENMGEIKSRETHMVRKIKNPNILYSQDKLLC